MSQEDVELLRDGYEEFGRTGSLPLDLLDADLDFRQPGPNPIIGGRDELIGAIADFSDAFEGFRIVPQEFIDAGQCIVVIVRMGGRAKDTGIAIDQEIGHVWKIHDGKAVVCHAYANRADAFQAVGLAD